MKAPRNDCGLLNAARVAVGRPGPKKLGRSRWHLLCSLSRKRGGYWWVARDGERRCRTCEALIERARHRSTASAAGSSA